MKSPFEIEPVLVAQRYAALPGVASEKVTLDVGKLLETRLLLQANSGGGKSWALRVLLERIGPHVQTVVLDRDSEFGSLRERLDVLLVGAGGELPAAVANAGALAIKLLEMNVSAVIGLYELTPQNRRAYVRRFLENLMAAPKSLWRPLLVVVDEAHDFCPEDSEAESAAGVIELMCMGRKRGFCGLLATQRLSKLHKDAAAECNNVMVGRCTLDLDQNRARKSLGLNNDQTRALARLSDDQPGQFWAYGPAFNFRGVEKVRTIGAQTTHPRPGKHAGYTPPAPSAKMAGALGDLKALGETKAGEVRDLDEAKKTITELRKELATKTRLVSVCNDRLVTAEAKRGPEDGAEVKSLRDRCKAIERVLRLSQGWGWTSLLNLEALTERMAKIIADAKDKQPAAPEFKDVPVVTHPAMPNGQVKVARGESFVTHVIPVGPPVRFEKAGTEVVAVQDDEAGPSGSELGILESIAWWNAAGVERPTREQVAFRARKTVGGQFNKLLGSMRSRGLVEYPEGNTVALTEAGREAAPGVLLEGLHELHTLVLEMLKPKGRKIMETLLEHYPDTIRGTVPHTREELAAAVGSTVGGQFNKLLGSMRSKGLVEYPRGNCVQAAACLFPEALV